MRGRLIAIEGLDGVGKTTLSRTLATALGAAWGTTPDPAVRDMRALIDRAWVRGAQVMFYAASVRDAGDHARALNDAGQDVVLDRYWLSTRAYAAPEDDGTLDAIEPSIRQADLTLFLESDEIERCKRLVGRGMTEADVASMRDVARLRSRYLALLDSRVAGCGVRLDVTGLSRADALRACLDAVQVSSAPRQLAMFDAPQHACAGAP